MSVTPRGEAASPGLLNDDRAHALMERESIDFLVASTPTNFVYVSNFGRTALFEFGSLGFAVLPRDRATPSMLIIPQFELASLVEHEPSMDEIRTAGTWGVTVREDAALSADEAEFQVWLARTQASHEPSPIEGLARGLRELGAEGKHVGFDDVRIASDLASANATLHARDARQLFRDIRAIKTAEEIRRLREAAVRNDEALATALRIIQPGVLWQDVIDAYERASLQRRSRMRHWVGGAGARASAHFPDTSYRIAANDLVRIDCGGTYEHYSSDTGRTAYVGTPPSDLREKYRALQAGIAAGEAAARPGVRASELYHIVLNAVRTNGLPHFYLPNVGHAIGLEQYDSIRLAPSEDFVLEPDFVFNLEVPHYELGWGGVQLEDTFCITPDGVERLTTLPREVLSVGVGTDIGGAN